MRRTGRAAVVAAPPLALAIAGVVHPIHLTAATAPLWRDLHIFTLPLFPLLGIAGWVLLRPVSRPLAAVAAVLGFVYAAGYTALDVLAGIGAGALAAAGLGGEGVLFAWADAIALPAVFALLAMTLLVAARLVPLRPAVAIPGGVVAVAASVSYLNSHIVGVRGVLTMIGFAAGWALLALAVPGDARTARPRAARGSVRSAA